MRETGRPDLCEGARGPGLCSRPLYSQARGPSRCGQGVTEGAMWSYKEDHQIGFFHLESLGSLIDRVVPPDSFCRRLARERRQLFRAWVSPLSTI